MNLLVVAAAYLDAARRAKELHAAVPTGAYHEGQRQAHAAEHERCGLLGERLEALYDAEMVVMP